MRSSDLLRLNLILAVILCLCQGCLKEDTINRTFTNLAPLETDDGRAVSSPEAEHIDADGLNKMYKELYEDENSWALRSMLVFRNRKLVAESYFKDEADRYNKRAIWSCTKQITSLVVGIAIQEGYIKSLTDPISDYLPEVANHADKKDITIAELLTMQSGIFFDNGTESDVFRQRKTNSSINYVLRNELKWQPGTYFQYNDGAPQLISGIIQHSTGMTLSEYADKNLFSKIGLTNYQWRNYKDGFTLGAFGLLMPPRELAKVAQCVCDSGKWNNQQIVPEEWLREALTTRVANIHENIGFGYFWWVNQKEGYVFMWGHGGQYAIIYPGKELLVIITGLEQVDDGAAIWYQKAIKYANLIEQLAR